MAELWQVIRRGSWKERLTVASLFLLLVGGLVLIPVLAAVIEGR